MIQADSISYDSDTEIVTASGNVEIINEDRILRADQVEWNKKTDVVRAEGNVVSLQPSGEVMFAQSAEVTSDMKEGFVDRISVLFPDNSRLAANDARRYGGRWLVADRGVYSACDLCADDPRKPPLWQVKGVRITHDSVKENVIYRDATVEFGGIPLIYTPYLSHPAPGVTRRQGFLMASGGYSKNLGAFARVPYYFDIAPNTDAVFMPTFSEEDSLQLGGEFRHRFERGNMRLAGSVTHADLVDEFGVDQGKQWRGHLFGSSLFSLNEVWRAGADVAFTSDKSYLQRYAISSTDVLVNRAFVEGFRGRNYALANMYYFQDLRPGDRPEEPFVAPEVTISALGEPGQTFGGRWSAGAGMLSTTRRETSDIATRGPDVRRLSFNGGWNRRMFSSLGLLADVGAFGRLDGYLADNVPPPAGGSGEPSSISRLRPFAQADATMRYPLARRGESYQHLLEPIVMLSAAPRTARDVRLPNEDSLEVSFDETNLFSSNRFAGIDRVEGGTRIAYGLRNAMVGDNGARIEMVGGSVYRFSSDDAFPEDSGLRRSNSDLVWRTDFEPREWINFNYGFRLDGETFAFQRQELRGSAGVPEFRPSIVFLSARQTQADGVSGTVKEITFGITSTPVKYWSISASHRRALEPSPGPRLTVLGVIYEDECFRFGVTGQRDHTNRKDISSGDSVMFHFYMKNIGGLQTDQISGDAVARR